MSLDLVPKILKHYSIPSESVSNSIPPLNMVRSLLSFLVRVPIVAENRLSPTLSFTNCDGLPISNILRLQSIFNEQSINEIILSCYLAQLFIYLSFVNVALLTVRNNRLYLVFVESGNLPVLLRIFSLLY